MKTVQLLQKALVACGVVVLLGASNSAKASLIPQPLICISDINGNPTVTSQYLDEILDPSDSVPTITYGIESVEMQFYVFPVFEAVPGARAVILTGAGNTPTEIVIFTVSQLLGKNSVDIYFADYTNPDFANTIATWAGAPTIAQTGSQIDVSTLLTTEEGIDLCVDCGGGQVPDNGPTFALLGLSLGAVALLYEAKRRAVKIARQQ